MSPVHRPQWGDIPAPEPARTAYDATASALNLDILHAAIRAAKDLPPLQPRHVAASQATLDAELAKVNAPPPTEPLNSFYGVPLFVDETLPLGKFDIRDGWAPKDNT